MVNRAIHRSVTRNCADVPTCWSFLSAELFSLTCSSPFRTRVCSKSKVSIIYLAHFSPFNLKWLVIVIIFINCETSNVMTLWWSHVRISVGGMGGGSTGSTPPLNPILWPKFDTALMHNVGKISLGPRLYKTPDPHLPLQLQYFAQIARFLSWMRFQKVIEFK